MIDWLQYFFINVNVILYFKHLLQKSENTLLCNTILLFYSHFSLNDEHYISFLERTCIIYVFYLKANNLWNLICYLLEIYSLRLIVVRQHFEIEYEICPPFVFRDFLGNMIPLSYQVLSVTDQTITN